MNLCKIEKNNKKIVMYNSKFTKNIKLCRSLFRVGVNNIDLKNKNNLNLLVSSISLYYSLYDDKRCLDLIEKIITNNSLDIEAKIYLYWQLVRVNFIDEEARKYIKLDQVYEHILRTINTEIDEKIQSLSNEFACDDKIAVFITNQFLTNDHSPTKVLLSIVKSINDKFENIEKVYIFNSREMPSTIEYYYYNPMIANCIDDYTDEVLSYVMTEEKIDRCKIYYDQGNQGGKTIERMENMLEDILKLNPKIIISVGGSNILADLCNKFIDTYTVAISGEVPISKCKYLVNIDNVNSIVKTKNNYNQYNIKIPVSMSDVSIKNISEDKYTRGKLGISDEIFLISIIGNRLKLEVTKEFLEVCIDILTKNSNCALMFIGKFDKEIIKSNVDSTIYNRIYNIDYASNLVSAIELSDLYLNPIRNGGGLSAVSAIKSGIPVISTNSGDISIYLSDEFKVDNYDEMKILVNSIVENKEIYEDFKYRTEKLYSNHSKSTWEEFINYILKA